MKALFLGTLAASQATAIIEFITADVRTEILDNNEPAQAAAALADADIVLTGAWRSGFPAVPKLRLLQVPLAGTDGIDVSSLRFREINVVLRSWPSVPSGIGIPWLRPVQVGSAETAGKSLCSGAHQFGVRWNTVR